jgi:hypothetical protein
MVSPWHSVGWLNLCLNTLWNQLCRSERRVNEEQKQQRLSNSQSFLDLGSIDFGDCILVETGAL